MPEKSIRRLLGYRDFCETRRRNRDAGLTLIELIVVIAILSLGLVLVRPAVSTLAGGREVNRAAGDFAMLLEHARVQATARQTYTWVLFAAETGSSGEDKLSAIVLASLDGTPNFTEANLRQVSRKLSFANVVLAETDSLQVRTQMQLPGSERGIQVATGSGASGYSIRVGETNFERGLAFSPRGEAMVEARGGSPVAFDALIDIGLRQTRGGQPPQPDADDAAILLFGASGRVITVSS